MQNKQAPPTPGIEGSITLGYLIKSSSTVFKKRLLFKCVKYAEELGINLKEHLGSV